MPYPQENLVSSSRSISARAASSNSTFSTLTSSMATWLWRNKLETIYAIKVYHLHLWIAQILIQCHWSTFDILHGNLGRKDEAKIAFKKRQQFQHYETIVVIICTIWYIYASLFFSCWWPDLRKSEPKLTWTQAVSTGKIQFQSVLSMYIFCNHWMSHTWLTGILSKLHNRFILVVRP